MRIAIFGLGYVGCTAACCIAKQGHQVVGIDVNEKKVAEFNAGISPIREPKLDELLKEGVASGSLSATTDIPEGLSSFDMAIVCVGTPSNIDGSHDMGFIANVTKKLASSLDLDRESSLTIAFRSTFRPGTIEQLVSPIFETSLGAEGMKSIELVYNPEFLREGTAIDDYFNPPKIVIGTYDGEASANMEKLHEGIDAEVFYTNYREAEITKFVDNTWHAVKVAFANEVGRVCQKMDISARKIHEIFVSDTKLNISSYYTRPGGAFGGSCLPKDVRALQKISLDVGAGTYLIDSLLPSNDTHKLFQFQQAVANLPAGSKVLLVGLAFKANTDDLRESPNLDMARRLLEDGFELDVYDESLDASRLIGQNLGYAYSHLPTLDRLLVTKEIAESSDYQLVISANDDFGKLEINCPQKVNIGTIS
ncbi:nucleotide sugar dehydrogenase [Sneathiella marina]|uniref:UDP-glucose 6-dehydrogenase n=1 Tax=Sneathiella marina TaxID=2950108 RepID=A0ABY4W2B3_9PROT|nr:nucleotide sugar dehydrogenase [Sneathiella marina]USG61305.1 nucleotide sugar dehydrogenase [Sneathiella marina]